MYLNTKPSLIQILRELKVLFDTSATLKMLEPISKI